MSIIEKLFDFAQPRSVSRFDKKWEMGTETIILRFRSIV